MITIDCNYSGGNVIVRRREGNTFFVDPDLRDTDGWWFYFNFRVCGAKCQTLTFVFGERNVSPFGPAVSYDGLTWVYDPNVERTDKSFTYTFDADKTYFAFAFAYQTANLEAAIANNTALKRITLGKSNKGRTVYALTAGTGKTKIALSCRHHACESVASYVLEGMLNELPERPALLEKYSFYILPFADLDGVEDGDQGKNRIPHDHNRDYTDTPIYNSVRLWTAFIDGVKPDAGIDLHNPWLFGGKDDYTSFIFSQYGAQNYARLSALTAETTKDSFLVHLPEHDMPFGVLWNTEQAETRAFDMYRRSGAVVYGSVEIPYFGVKRPTTDHFRKFGVDLLCALDRYFTEKRD